MDIRDDVVVVVVVVVRSEGWRPKPMYRQVYILEGMLASGTSRGLASQWSRHDMIKATMSTHSGI